MSTYQRSICFLGFSLDEWRTFLLVNGVKKNCVVSSIKSSVIMMPKDHLMFFIRYFLNVMIFLTKFMLRQKVELNHMVIVHGFEFGWKMVIDKYKLQNNTSLVHSFDFRHKYAKAYFPWIFYAKQTSTGCGESANPLLKTYVPIGCRMLFFEKQYQRMPFERAAEESHK